MDSLYLGMPEDVYNRKIDGWYEDKEDSRYTEQAKEDRKEYTSYANITGSDEVHLIAAGKPSLDDEPAAPDSDKTSSNPDVKSAQTGDSNNIAIWMALLFVSGGAAIATTVAGKKRKYNK